MKKLSASIHLTQINVINARNIVLIAFNAFVYTAAFIKYFNGCVKNHSTFFFPKIKIKINKYACIKYKVECI